MLISDHQNLMLWACHSFDMYFIRLYLCIYALPYNISPFFLSCSNARSGYSSISKPRSFREKPHQFSFERQSEFIMPTDISVSTSIYVNIVTYMDENETFQYIYRRLSLVLCSSVSSSLFTTKTFVSLRGWTLLLLYAVGYGSGTEWKNS